ncbi:MAG: hypothetical protein EOP37_23690 [Rubrivivax sp.]|nr:MAG: hypothetical protein EOP37_23690 [Rubrivivax sp.]
MRADFAEFDLLDDRSDAQIVSALADLLQVSPGWFLPQQDFWSRSLGAARAVAFEATHFAGGAPVFVRLSGNFELLPAPVLGHSLALRLRTPVVIGDEGRRPPGAVLVFHPEGRVVEGIELPSRGYGHEFEFLDEIPLDRVVRLDGTECEICGELTVEEIRFLYRCPRCGNTSDSSCVSEESLMGSFMVVRYEFFPSRLSEREKAGLLQLWAQWEARTDQRRFPGQLTAESLLQESICLIGPPETRRKLDTLVLGCVGPATRVESEAE